jgi:hypothetical protein
MITEREITTPSRPVLCECRASYREEDNEAGQTEQDYEAGQTTHCAHSWGDLFSAEMIWFSL